MEISFGVIAKTFLHKLVDIIGGLGVQKLAQSTKMDLNEKLSPKQKTTQAFKDDTQEFRIVIL